MWKHTEEKRKGKVFSRNQVIAETNSEKIFVIFNILK